MPYPTWFGVQMSLIYPYVEIALRGTDLISLAHAHKEIYTRLDLHHIIVMLVACARVIKYIHLAIGIHFLLELSHQVSMRHFVFIKL